MNWLLSRPLFLQGVGGGRGIVGVGGGRGIVRVGGGRG